MLIGAHHHTDSGISLHLMADARNVTSSGQPVGVNSNNRIKGETAKTGIPAAARVPFRLDRIPTRQNSADPSTRSKDQPSIV